MSSMEKKDHDSLFRDENQKSMIIAEIGTAHGGEIGKGLELVDAAIDAGADIVKFQHVKAEEIIHPKTGQVKLPGGKIDLFKSFKELETGISFLARLKERVEKAGRLFLCTPFGIQTARELKELDVAIYKTASPELNYLQLLEEISLFGRPCILSTGVASLADIEEALTVFRKKDSDYKLALLHCITAYPAPPEEYNLRLLKSLGKIFGLPVGISDHSLDPVLVPSISAALGAWAVEKHICLSKKGGGLDDPVALEPEDFRKMVRAVRAFYGRGQEGLDELAMEFGSERIKAILGDGVKRLAASEAENYGRSNRSIHASGCIEKGQELTESNLAILRTEKNLIPGLHPRYLPVLKGRRAMQRIEDGQGVLWDDVL